MSEHIPLPEKPPKHDGMLVTRALPIEDDERIPAGYTLWQRHVRLLNGNMPPAFYSTREGKMPDAEGWERSRSSVMAGFVWALTVPEFRDNETEDDDRTQEIGNMMSYAISQGFTEEQIVECYEQAYVLASESRDQR